jgi:hypothetical protein
MRAVAVPMLAVTLTAPSSLRIEGFSGATCGDASTWSLTGGAVTFAR